MLKLSETMDLSTVAHSGTPLPDLLVELVTIGRATMPELLPSSVSGLTSGTLEPQITPDESELSVSVTAGSLAGIPEHATLTVGGIALPAPIGTSIVAVEEKLIAGEVQLVSVAHAVALCSTPNTKPIAHRIAANLTRILL